MKSKNVKREYDAVILTYHPNDIIIDSIKRLLTQSVKPKRIIIYNTDEKVFYKNITKRNEFEKLLKNKIIKVFHIKKEHFDHGKTRNDAAKLCSSNYILFMTDDAEPYDKNMAKNLLTSFDIDGVVVSNARQMPRKDASITERYIREYNYPSNSILKDKTTEKKYGIKNYYASNVCSMLDRKVFNKLKGFDTNIILNEDTFYAYKVIDKGYKVYYNAYAKVYHSHNLSYMEQFSRNFDIGVSQEEKKKIFDKINSISVGTKFAKDVFVKLISKMHFISAMSFIIECAYRYMGYKKGKKFLSLPLDKCIKYATNKNYFIRKKNVSSRYSKK